MNKLKTNKDKYTYIYNTFGKPLSSMCQAYRDSYPMIDNNLVDKEVVKALDNALQLIVKQLKKYKE